MVEDEACGGVLGPVAVIAAGRVRGGQEGAVSAMRRFQQLNAGVRGDGCAGWGCEANEGVVAGVEDEGRDSDAMEDACGRGSMVVVVGVAEAGVEGGDFVVEVAQGVHDCGTVRVKGAGIKKGFTAETFQQGVNEAAFVEAIGGFVQGISGGSEVDGGGDADDGAELRRGVRAEIAGQLENKIAAHAVADQGEGGELVKIEKVAHDGVDVRAHAGVVKGGREALRTAAVAHVHANDVATGVPELGGVATHVLRSGRALQAVQDKDGRTGGADAGWLPMALAEDLGADLVSVGRNSLDELGDGRGERFGARQKVAGYRLEMAIAEPGAGMKRRKPGRPGCLCAEGVHQPAPLRLVA